MPCLYIALYSQLFRQSHVSRPCSAPTQAEQRALLQSLGAEVDASHDSDADVQPRHASLPDLAHGEQRGRLRRMLGHLHRTRPDGEQGGVRHGGGKSFGGKLKRRWRQRRADDRGISQHSRKCPK